ncbi:MAG: shikimate dehydrogenase family protein [Cytophagaceae bacterium]
MRLFGLIGYPLTHSFSKKYFTEKFDKENITDARYELFELKDISEFPEVLKNNPDLCGLNVTIPYKEAIIPYLDELDEPVKNINAVNVIKVEKGKILKGYNSDYYGFKVSLLKLIQKVDPRYKSLILGSGGASKAVCAALDDLGIPYLTVSRKADKGITYSDIDESLIRDYQIIINTTPLGMYPKTDSCPDIPYNFLTSDHYLFDLVYNPEETLFMQRGKAAGAQTKNGLEMLYLQAEKAWEIWNS